MPISQANELIKVTSNIWNMQKIIISLQITFQRLKHFECPNISVKYWCVKLAKRIYRFSNKKGNT